MIKVLGTCLVLLSSTGLGISMGLDLKKRIADLKYLKKIILMLRGEIKYTKTPLPEAFLNISFRIQEPFQALMENIAGELEELRGDSFQTVWKKRIAEDLGETRLSKKDLEQLERLGENFGYLDGEMQLGTIDLYIEQLDQEIGQAEKTAGEKVRIYNCLGIMGGIFVVIIML